MAKPGRASQIGGGGGRRETRQRLIEAAIETLQVEGFSGASARTIANRAGCNQALVFYHFGTVVDLLLAALDQTSQARTDRYQAAVRDASTAPELAAIAIDIYREDLDGGHIAVLAEMIAGVSSTPGLGIEVAARIDPWIDFTETALRRLLASTPLAGIVPTGDAAYAVVAFYLGLELLAHVGNDRTRAESLLETAARLSALAATLAPPQSPSQSSPAAAP